MGLSLLKSHGYHAILTVALRYACSFDRPGTGLPSSCFFVTAWQSFSCSVDSGRVVRIACRLFRTNVSSPAVRPPSFLPLFFCCCVLAALPGLATGIAWAGFLRKPCVYLPHPCSLSCGRNRRLRIQPPEAPQCFRTAGFAPLDKRSKREQCVEVARQLHLPNLSSRAVCVVRSPSSSTSILKSFSYPFRGTQVKTSSFLGHRSSLMSPWFFLCGRSVCGANTAAFLPLRLVLSAFLFCPTAFLFTRVLVPSVPSSSALPRSPGRLPELLKFSRPARLDLARSLCPVSQRTNPSTPERKSNQANRRTWLHAGPGTQTIRSCCRSSSLRHRADELLVCRGIAESRSEAASLIALGYVAVSSSPKGDSGTPCGEKPVVCSAKGVVSKKSSAPRTRHRDDPEKSGPCKTSGGTSFAAPPVRSRKQESLTGADNSCSSSVEPEAPARVAKPTSTFYATKDRERTGDLRSPFGVLLSSSDASDFGCLSSEGPSSSKCGLSQLSLEEQGGEGKRTEEDLYHDFQTADRGSYENALRGWQALLTSGGFSSWSGTTPQPKLRFA